MDNREAEKLDEKAAEERKKRYNRKVKRPMIAGMAAMGLFGALLIIEHFNFHPLSSSRYYYLYDGFVTAVGVFSIVEIIRACVNSKRF